MKKRRRRKLSTGELVLGSVVILAMAISSFLFLSYSGVLGSPTGNDLDVILSSETDPEPDEGAEPGEGENGNDYDLATEPIDATDPAFNPAEYITVVDIADMGSEQMTLRMMNPNLFDDLDEESLAHTSAGVSLVVYDGYSGLYFTYQYGHADIAADRPVDVDTKFRIASLSKLVVAICAMRLVDEGKLDLDEDIETYLGYRVRHPDHPNSPITTRMLLQHTSSIFDSQAFHDSISGSVRVSTETLLSRSSSYWGVRPGAAFEYSNFGYTIVGAICEFVSGKKLDDFAREFLFDPLAIDASFLAANLRDTANIANLYDASHDVRRSVNIQIEQSRTGELGQDQHLAQGSLMISAFDYAKIVAMLGNGGVFQGVRILSQEAVSEIHNADFETAEYKQGLSSRFSNDGLLGLDNGYYWHTGSAYGVFAQYIYAASSGTDEGVGGANTSLGVVVVTTGASTGRSESGMINVCTHLAEIAWPGLGFDQLDMTVHRVPVIN